MPEVLTDIIVPFPKGKLYTAPVGTALPADTVAVGGTWTGWTSVGYLDQPVKLTYKFDMLEIKVLQALGSVDRRKTNEELLIETVLSELTLDNVALALSSGTVTQTAAGAGQPGKEEYTLGGIATLNKKMIGFEGAYLDEDGAEFPIRVFVWKATASEGLETEWDKEKIAGVPLKWAALQDLTKPDGQRLCKWQKILEPAT